MVLAAWVVGRAWYSCGVGKDRCLVLGEEIQVCVCVCVCVCNVRFVFIVCN